MTSGKTAAFSIALAAQGLALILWVVAAEPPSPEFAAEPHFSEVPTEPQLYVDSAKSKPKHRRVRRILKPLPDSPPPGPDKPSSPETPSEPPPSRSSDEPQKTGARPGPWPHSEPSDGLPAVLAPPGTLTVQIPDGVCGAATVEPKAFSHQVGHQRIAFSWPTAEGARFYRLQESREGGGFKGIKGAARIADTSYCLRIRHWDIVWGQMRYRLLACPGEDQPCTGAGSLDLAAEAANRSVADIIDPGIRSASHFHLRTALALSADGNTMVWSGSEPGNRNIDPDTVNISVRDSGVWRLQDSFLTGHEWSRSHTDVAKAVALSADGSVLAFGATGHVPRARLLLSGRDRRKSGEGAVYVYARDGRTWSLQAVIVPGEIGRRSFEFGTALALSADGRTLAVGQSRAFFGPQPEEDTRRPDSAHGYYGLVAVFQMKGGEWARQDVLRAPEHGYGDFFGQSLALSADGGALAVGSPGDDGGYQPLGRVPDPEIDPVDDSGAVYIYTRSGGSWRPGIYIKGGGARYGDRLGTSVSLNAAGNLLVAGAPRLSPGTSYYSTPAPDYPTNEPVWSAGAAYLFALREGRWTQTARLSEGTPGVHDGFGASVSLSGTGDILVVGAPEEASGPEPGPHRRVGAVYVYSVSEEGAVLRRRLGDPRPRPWGRFGAFLALSADGGTLSIAAPGWIPTPGSGILDGDPRELGKIIDYGWIAHRSLYVY